ncbi:MAG: TlyA family RNA methyltransferase, partial [Elusimicrobiota bacterium]|nr:TlyA family RNA methyltransferase [Elusimicrobiota bacterium]
GYKLEHAIKHFGIQVENKICLDVGSSTGGFVDCLLQHGAKRIYAVDVGKGLLHYKLRDNPKIVIIEDTNFRYFPVELLKDKIDLTTIDVSFISLEKILPKVKEIASTKSKIEGMEILCLVKPQFETERKYLRKGVVKDTEIQISTVNKIRQFAQSIGFEYRGMTPSPLKGPKGNTEYFLWLHREVTLNENQTTKVFI